MTVYLLANNNFNFAKPDFAFDVTIDESRSVPFDVTQYPVESGALVSDHVFKLPERFKERGGISALDYAGGGLDLPTRRQDLLDTLIELADARGTVTLVSPNWIADVAIVDVQASASQSSGESLEVSIEFSQIERPTFETTEIPPERLAPAVKAGSEKATDAANGAKQAPTGAAAKPVDTSDNSSILFEGVDAFETGNRDLIDAGAAVLGL